MDQLVGFCLARLTDFGCVVGRTENEFGRPVIPGADIGHIRLVLYQNLCASEIAQLQHTTAGVEEEVLRLDVAMADALRVDVGQSAKQLVDIKLDLQDGHGGLHFIEEPRGPVHRLRYELLYQVEVHFIFLWRR